MSFREDNTTQVAIAQVRGADADAMVGRAADADINIFGACLFRRRFRWVHFEVELSHEEMNEIATATALIPRYPNWFDAMVSDKSMLATLEKTSAFAVQFLTRARAPES
jgi:hypothetical protein